MNFLALAKCPWSENILIKRDTVGRTVCFTSIQRETEKSHILFLSVGPKGRNSWTERRLLSELFFRNNGTLTVRKQCCKIAVAKPAAPSTVCGLGSTWLTRGPTDHPLTSDNASWSVCLSCCCDRSQSRPCDRWASVGRAPGTVWEDVKRSQTDGVRFWTSCVWVSQKALGQFLPYRPTVREDQKCQQEASGKHRW